MYKDRRYRVRAALSHGVLALTVTVALLSSVPVWVGTAHGATSSVAGLHIVGNQIVNASGQSVRLVGVNRSGTEYACIQGWGTFDGPADAASVQAIVSWHVNAVRIPLNEDCWLGINGVSPSLGGTAYQTAVENYVTLLNQNGIAAILDLHWNAPGGQKATGQLQMPDQDHAPAFWQSVATAFKTDPSVLFDLYNEPHDVTWTCWRDGGTCSGVPYQVAGMQELVNIVRATGAPNIILLGGLTWSNDLSQWLQYKPIDPRANVAAAWHSYNFNGCSNQSCWDSQIAPIAKQVPVVAGEIGENDCAATYVSSLMTWLDNHGASYLAWSWNLSSCGGGPSLITSWNGTPTAYGAGVKQHLAAGVAGNATTTAITSTPASTATPTATSTPTAPATATNTPQATATKTPQPTATATATQTVQPTVVVSTAYAFDFEDGSTEGWHVQWGSETLANSSAHAFSGTRALGVTMTRSDYPGISTSAGLANLRPGMSVTYHLYAPRPGVGVTPYACDGNWTSHTVPGKTLSVGWTTLTWTVPPMTGLKCLGFQVIDSHGWTGEVDLDAVQL